MGSMIVTSPSHRETRGNDAVIKDVIDPWTGYSYLSVCYFKNHTMFSFFYSDVFFKRVAAVVIALTFILSMFSVFRIMSFFIVSGDILVALIALAAHSQLISRI